MRTTATAKNLGFLFAGIGLVGALSMIIGVSDASAASRRVCTSYADLAVHQQMLNRRYRCGFVGPRWHSNWWLHYSWCRGMPFAAQRNERTARWRMLRACGVPPRRSVRRTFRNPKVGGLPLDWCKFWSRQCGGPAADTFCRMKGYRRAVAWSKATDIGRWTPTRVITTWQVCRGNFCDGFRAITCTR